VKNRFLTAAVAAVLAALTLPNKAAAQFGGYGSYGGYRSSHHDAALLNWLMYQAAKEDGKNLRRWWKQESTWGYAHAGPIKYSNRIYFDSSFYPGDAFGRANAFDTTLSGTAKPKYGFSVNGNSNHMIARTGRNSMITFSVGTQVDWVVYDDIKVFDAFADVNNRRAENSSLSLYQISLPLTLDFKSGCDVDFDPDQPICFAFGGGAAPTLSLVNTSNWGVSGGRARWSPYIYGSVGFYAMGCWKVRASYMPGAFVNHTDEDDNSSSTVATMNLQGSNVFTIGISFMTYSWDWGEGQATRGGISGKSGGGGGRNSGRRFRARRKYNGMNMRF